MNTPFNVLFLTQPFLDQPVNIVQLPVTNLKNTSGLWEINLPTGRILTVSRTHINIKNNKIILEFKLINLVREVTAKRKFKGSVREKWKGV